MFPENHAAPVPPWPGQDLPRTAPAPAHMAAPMTDGRPTSSPERNCRTLQGPSAKEWARHRDTIIDLYKQYPLKRVNEIMKRHHGFSASKRMYDKRFREWNVFKNTNGDEKERATRRAQGSRLPVSPGASSNISQEDLRQTVRCARTIKQDVRTSPANSTPVSPVIPVLPCPVPRAPERGSISISDLVSHPNPGQPTAAIELPKLGMAPNAPVPLPDGTCQTPHSSSDLSAEHTQDRSQARSATTTPGPSLATYRAQLHTLAKSPPPLVAPDARTRTMDFIALKLREYFDWQLENIPGGVAPDDYLGRRTSVESTRYWTTIKDALYLVKISAGSVDDLDNRPDRRAWPAFAEAGCLAAEAMKTQPFDFLRNLFATLSPANTSARPELRSILLQFLTSEAQSSLSPNHPITQICQELQRDDDCQEVSRRGLQCMLDIFNSRLGPSRATTFKLLDSLATLLRRNGEFHAAMEVITELLKSCRETFGPDSDEARAVENELAHFYMSIDECDLALGHCMSVVTRPPAASQEGKPVFYQDGISAHTMEDIAEIHQRRGDMEQSIAWLERAASIALSVWGPKAVATGHIIDKMTSLQRQFGKDLLRSAKLWEAALD